MPEVFRFRGDERADMFDPEPAEIVEYNAGKACWGLTGLTPDGAGASGPVSSSSLAENQHVR
jgi:hypothetical protein